MTIAGSLTEEFWLLRWLWVWLWVWGIGSWCMCCYVVCSSCESFRWFRFLKNPLLIVGALGSLVAWACGWSTAPCASIGITALGWSCYSALVTMQHFRFRQWKRHILPVNFPTCVVVAWYAASCGNSGFAA